MKFLAIIPARGGSKGVPRKNIKMLCGKPLIAWTIGHALSAHSIDRAVVSTDDDEIAQVSRDFGADVPFIRPDKYATDAASTEDVMIHAILELAKVNCHPDAVVLLQPTCPVRSDDAIDKAVNLFLRSNADSLVSTSEIHPFIWQNPSNAKASYDFENRPRRQNLNEEARRYEENGSIYITRTELLLSKQCRLGGKIVIYPMSKLENIDIDCEYDFLLADAVLKTVGKI
jgi:CMP-N,N'-diacetyllegionaminic acid synthase